MLEELCKRIYIFQFLLVRRLNSPLTLGILKPIEMIPFAKCYMPLGRSSKDMNMVCDTLTDDRYYIQILLSQNGTLNFTNDMKIYIKKK